MTHAQYVDSIFKAMKKGQCPYKIRLFTLTNRLVLDLGKGKLIGDWRPND